MAFLNTVWFSSPANPWSRFRRETHIIVNNSNNSQTSQERARLDSQNNIEHESSSNVCKINRNASDYSLEDKHGVTRKLFNNVEDQNDHIAGEKNHVHVQPPYSKPANSTTGLSKKTVFADEYSMANITELSDEGLFSEVFYGHKDDDMNDSLQERQASPKNEVMSSEVEFALDCTIENCECHKNWESKKKLLKQQDFIAVLNTSPELFEQKFFKKKSTGNGVSCFVCIDSPCSCQDNEWAPFVRHGMVRQEQTSVDETDDIISVTSNVDSDGYDYSTNIINDAHAKHDAYEVISWDAASNRDFSNFVMNSKLNNEYRNTGQDSPQLDLSGLDGYHTAPTTPSYGSNEYIIIDKTDDSTSTNGILSNHSTNASLEAMSRSSQGHDSCNNHAHHFPLESFSADMTNSINSIDDDAGFEHNNAQNDACASWGRPDEAVSTRSTQYPSTAHVQARIRLPMPPYIDATSIQYQGDSTTGEALVIGKGSFGVVYKARFSNLAFVHLPIVVKEFDDEYSNAKEIIQEAQRLYYLKDTRYVPVCYGILTYGENDKQKYGIVQEYVGTGLTLEQLLWEQYDLSFEYWFIIAYQCCEGLAMFHEKGILLNDIKSNNILLEFSERSVRIRFIDFGLATDMTGKKYKNTKSLENFVYLAPEVRRYGETTTIASDIYSLGYMIEQIRRTFGVFELTIVARLCMDRDPTMRLPVRGAMSLISEAMEKLGYAELIM